MIIRGKLYDVLKFIALILLPACGTLYFTLAGIWGLPNAEEVVGTIVAIDTFLGVVLQISSSAYQSSDDRFDGTMDVSRDGEKVIYTLNLKDDPEPLAEQESVTFKVQTAPDNGPIAA